MNIRTLLTTSAIVLLSLPAMGQTAKAPSVRMRAVLVDPVNPVVDLFVRDPSGKMLKVGLIADNLSEAQVAAPTNGSLVIYDTATVNPEKPEVGVVGTTKIPADLNRIIVVLVPAATGSTPKYRLVVIDDSPSGFPKGESRVLSLVPVETALEAGEHKLPISPGKLTNVPPVRKVNEFNMAQTNFYYREGGTWVPFTERQLQFLDEFRRVFLVHVSPGATHPSVTTILDTAPAVVPAG